VQRARAVLASRPGLQIRIVLAATAVILCRGPRVLRTLVAPDQVQRA
jgi:hypothetical protein